MLRPHLQQHVCLVLAVAGTLVLLLLALLTATHLQDHTRSEQRRLERQAALAGEAARRIEWPLQRLQEGLEHLASQPRDASGLPRGGRSGLELLFHEIPEPLLKALFIRSASGRLLAEYPSGSLSTDAPHRRALPPPAAASTAPCLASEDDCLLLLRQPLAARSGPGGEIGALIDLRCFVAASLTELADQASFGFLVDGQGRFLLHRNPDWDGKPATALVAQDREAALAVLLHRAGRQPVAAVDPASAGVLLAQPGPPPRLSLTPLAIGRNQWTLGLTFPTAAAGVALPPVWASPLLLACALLVGFLAWRLQRLEQQQRRLEGERSQLTRSLAQQQEISELARLRYHHLLDHAGDALFFIDPVDGSLQELNRQARELLGYSTDEIHTLSLGVLFPGQQRRRFLRLVRTVRRQGYGEADDLLFRRKDGSLFTGAVHARLGHLGTLEIVHGVLRDVSERKRIEQELRQRNRHLLLLNEISRLAADSGDLPGMLDTILGLLVENFAASGGGVYLARDSGTRLRLEAQRGLVPQVLDLLGEIPSDAGMVGRVMASGQAKASADLLRDRRVRFDAVREAGWRAFQAVPLTFNEQTIGVFFLFCDRKHIYPREEVNLLLAIGRQLGTAVQGTNLFEALQWQNRLTQASHRELELSRQKLRENLGRVTESKRALEHLDRMKSQFLALASHELRTPLTYILSGSELLAERAATALDADGQTALAAVQQGGRRLHEVVQDLLEVARIESKDLYLSREPVVPRDLLELLDQEFQPRLQERRLHLAVKEFPAAVHLYGDPHHLKKTFGRLLENAVKFTPAGGHIEICGQLQSHQQVQDRQDELRPFSPRFFSNPPRGPLLQISIRDSGVGIDPDEQLRIFDKFYEIGEVAGHFTSTSRFGGKGVGLGLALVKGVIEAHGGMVWVESAGTGGNAAGSAFHLLLPAGQAADGLAPPEVLS